MTITISAEDSRPVKAISIAAGAGQWLKVRGKDGRKAYGIRSSHGDRYYVVTQISCDCVDAQRHAGHPCKHQLAVRLHVELAKAERAHYQPRRAHPLEARRLADGEVVWERRPTVTPNAQRYDEIFGRP